MSKISKVGRLEHLLQHSRESGCSHLPFGMLYLIS